MPTNIRNNGGLPPTSPVGVQAERPTAAPNSATTTVARGAVVDDVRVQSERTVVRDGFHAEGKAHEAVVLLQVAREALAAMPGFSGDRAKPAGEAAAGLESAFSQLEKLAQSMRNARVAVLEKPIPNSEAAEYIAKMVAEQIAQRTDTVAVVARRLPESAIGLAS